MADFEEKLNALLSNPDAMAQIMHLAQSLGTQQSPPQDSSPPPPQPFPSQPPPPPPPGASVGGPPPQGPADNPDPFSFFSGLDPSLLVKLFPLIQELGSGQNSNARQLLFALRPYLKEERQAKVERALQLARLFHLGKKFLANWED